MPKRACVDMENNWARQDLEDVKWRQKIELKKPKK